MKKISYVKNTKRFLYIFISLSVLVGSLTGVIYSIERNNIIEETLIQSRNDIELFSKSFTEKISFVNTDVFILKDLIGLNDVLELDGLETVFTSAENRESVENDFKIWLDRKNIYDQARIIDNTGQEILRVNYNQSEPEVVSVELLENKDSRYYFTDSIILDENEMYISELDLNVENGVIETDDNGTTKPMIRFATPIFDSSGNKLGIIVLNYLADDILSSLKLLESSSFTNTDLINNDGYFLFSNKEDRLWGFMYDDMEDEIYSKYYDFDIFTNASESINQQSYKGVSYTSIRITAESLADKTSLILESDIHVILGVDDFIIVSSIEFNDIKGVVEINKIVFVISIILFLGVIIVSKMIDELLYNKEEKLNMVEHAANHDVLTDIPNRFYIYNLFRYKITRQHEFSILYMDFDGFKKINDKFGHSIGDEALIEGVKRIKDSIRLDDVVSRVGGDEFLVIINHIVDKKIITRICKTIIDNFNKDFNLKGNVCKMGISIGVSMHLKDSIDSDALIDHADKAMYEIKNKGKNNFKFYEDIEDSKK